jgi:hypothetical protein
MPVEAQASERRLVQALAQRGAHLSGVTHISGILTVA